MESYISDFLSSRKHILYVVSVIVLVYILYDSWRKQNTYKQLNHFYSKPTIPIIGHIHYVTDKLVGSMPKVLSELTKWRFPALVWIFHIPLVIIATPQDMKVVLNTARERGKMVEKIRNTLGDGILSSTGEKWRRSRRIVNLALLPSKMEQYLVIFDKYSNSLVGKLRSLTDTGKAFDLWPFICRLNIDVLYENLIGHKLHSLENDDNRYFEMIENEGELDILRYKQPLFYIDFVYNAFLKMTGKWRIFQKLKDLLQNIIREKIREQTCNFSPKPENMKVYCDMQLETHQIDETYTEECIRADLINMIQAGYATTARLVNFTVLMLAMHQNHQEKVYQEIETVIGNTDEPVKIDDLDWLVYLEQCINETLRRFTPLPASFRQNPQDIVLNDKQTIPANHHIFIFLHGLHNNPDVHPNPHIWDPNRFDDKAVRERDKYAFLPFGTGPRSCPGSKYAMISAKTQLVYLLRNYHFTTDMKMDDIELDMSVGLSSIHGYWVKSNTRMKAVREIV